MKRYAKVLSFVALAVTSVGMCGCTGEELMQLVSTILPLLL